MSFAEDLTACYSHRGNMTYSRFLGVWPRSRWIVWRSTIQDARSGSRMSPFPLHSSRDWALVRLSRLWPMARNLLSLSSYWAAWIFFEMQILFLTMKLHHRPAREIQCLAATCMKFFQLGSNFVLGLQSQQHPFLESFWLLLVSSALNRPWSFLWIF